MDRRWEDLTYRQRKIVTGLARSTRSNGPMMMAWLNQQDDVWDNIDRLAELFENNWGVSAQLGESQPKPRNAHRSLWRT